MNYDYWDVFFAVLILVFSFWKIGASDVIVIISAAFILIKAISNHVAHGMSMSSIEHRTGSELFLDKRKKYEPSRDEVKEVMEKKSSKKKSAKGSKKKSVKKISQKG